MSGADALCVCSLISTESRIARSLSSGPNHRGKRPARACRTWTELGNTTWFVPAETERRHNQSAPYGEASSASNHEQKQRTTHVPVSGVRVIQYIYSNMYIYVCIYIYIYMVPPPPPELSTPLGGEILSSLPLTPCMCVFVYNTPGYVSTLNPCTYTVRARVHASSPVPGAVPQQTEH